MEEAERRRRRAVEESIRRANVEQTSRRANDYRICNCAESPVGVRRRTGRRGAPNNCETAETRWTFPPDCHNNCETAETRWTLPPDCHNSCETAETRWTFREMKAGTFD